MKHSALLRKSDYLDVGLENKGLTESDSGAEQARIGENEREPTAEKVGNPCINAPLIAGAGLEKQAVSVETNASRQKCADFCADLPRSELIEFCRKYLLLLSDERLQALYRELEAEQPTVERLAAWERTTRQILGKPPLIDH